MEEDEPADSAIARTTRVLVAPLEPGEREATGLAALLTGYLHTEVGRQDGLESVDSLSDDFNIFELPELKA